MKVANKKKIWLVIITMITSFTISYAQQNTNNYENEKTILLENIGTLSSSTLFLTYGYLFFAKQMADSSIIIDNPQRITQPVENLMKIVHVSLKKIKENVEISENDNEFVSEIIKICDKLELTAKTVEKYLLTKDKNSSREATKMLDEVIKELEQLLGKENQ